MWRYRQGQGSCGKEKYPKLSCLGLHYGCSALPPSPRGKHVCFPQSGTLVGPAGRLLMSMQVHAAGPLLFQLPGPQSHFSWAPLSGRRDEGVMAWGGQDASLVFLSAFFSGRLSCEKLISSLWVSLFVFSTAPESMWPF